MARQLTEIGRALDEISWAWLGDNYPALAEAIRHEVTMGAQSEEIRRYVMHQTERLELALRCEQAARFLLTHEPEA